jgi:hypothetical protein
MTHPTHLDALAKEAKAKLRTLERKHANALTDTERRRFEKSIGLAMRKLLCAHTNTVAKAWTQYQFQYITVHCNDCKLETRIKIS